MLKTLVAACLVALALASGAPAAELGDDGLHKEDWFSLTFKDVAEDIETARENGKRLAIVFEQRGCIYCAKMHEELLADPAVADYIKEHFSVVQYNMFGDEEVTDLDGETLSEKTAARKWRVVFTPTILFMPEDVPENASVADAAVASMPGAFGKNTFLHMFQWVNEKGYDTDEHFQKYHARKLEESGQLGSSAE
ncbi:thioredoxin family protein [Fulvimarina sp. MAC3]|uniref:thioredoxin family protein n=1 Tax=Fulvimarina sp. MAC3 TaxID=3148887 RepID=UPI0031FC8B80